MIVKTTGSVETAVTRPKTGTNGNPSATATTTEATVFRNSLVAGDAGSALPENSVTVTSGDGLPATTTTDNGPGQQAATEATVFLNVDGNESAEAKSTTATAGQTATGQDDFPDVDGTNESRDSVATGWNENGADQSQGLVGGDLTKDNDTSRVDDVQAQPASEEAANASQLPLVLDQTPHSTSHENNISDKATETVVQSQQQQTRLAQGRSNEKRNEEKLQLQKVLQNAAREGRANQNHLLAHQPGADIEGSDFVPKTTGMLNTGKEQGIREDLQEDKRTTDRSPSSVVEVKSVTRHEYLPGSQQVILPASPNEKPARPDIGDSNRSNGREPGIPRKYEVQKGFGLSADDSFNVPSFLDGSGVRSNLSDKT